MKKDNVDDVIREALSQDEKEFYDSLGEPSLPEMMTGMFSGRLKWLTGLTMVFAFGFFIAAVVSAVQFFQAVEIRDMILWGAGFFTFMMAVTALKMWYWMEMERNTLTREIKRVELQIANLANMLRAGR